MVWHSHLFQNFPQFIVIHTVKGFGIVKAEIDAFLELSCFFHDPVDVGNLISGSSAFSKTNLNIWKFAVHVLLKPSLENFEHYLWYPVPSLHGKYMEKQWKHWQTLFWGSKITADGDCSHEIKRCLLLGRNAMTNLDSILKSRDIHYFANKGPSSQGYGFSYGHVWM